MAPEIISPLLIKLPKPQFRSETSIEEALLRRRSIRTYKKDPLQVSEISQLLWAAQGITSKDGELRTAPSAGALYPIEIYVVCGNINSIPAGVFHYLPRDHSLDQVIAGNKLKSLDSAALSQGAIDRSAAVILITAEYSKTTEKYYGRGNRYVHMEAGHVAQNIYLQAISLKIGTVVIGAFTDSEVKKVLQIPQLEEPLYLMPLGKV